jgi:RNA polymerase sigma factor (sigma-70 family)
MVTNERERNRDSYYEMRWKEFCEGDKKAFGEIAEFHYGALHHYGTRFTSDRDIIKDCLQDLFVQIWEKRELLHEVTSMKSYLFQSVRNNLIYILKKRSLFLDVEQVDLEKLESEISPETSWIIDEDQLSTQLKLKEAISQLPKRQKEALYLRYYQNMSYEEIAAIMGLKRQAVANYLQYGIQKLRENWISTLITVLALVEF